MPKSKAWSALAGQCDIWSDRAAADVGRARFHLRRGQPSELEPDRRRTGLVRSATVLFVARADPWCLATIEVRGEVTATLQAHQVAAVLEGEPAGLHLRPPDATEDDMGHLGAMLQTDLLGAVVPKPWPTAFEIPGPLLEEDESIGYVPMLVSLGIDSYWVTYDAKLDMITSWTASIDGQTSQSLRVQIFNVPNP